MSIPRKHTSAAIKCAGRLHVSTAPLVAALLALLVAPQTADGQQAAANSALPKSPLPKVLIIGDSISIGYTPLVTQMLQKEAVVKHHKGNAGPTDNGLKRLDQWLGSDPMPGSEKWDVIHFNWGLHDLCYRHPESKTQGHRDKVNGTLTTSLDQYEKNLDELVTRLKTTGAALIWAHTTVVPEEEEGRFVGDDKKYNDVATKVMKKHGIPINDLNALTTGFPSSLFRARGDVHFTQEGYQKIARQVASKIRETLQTIKP